MEPCTSHLRAGDFPRQTRKCSSVSYVASREKKEENAHHPFDSDTAVSRHWVFLLERKARLRAAAITRFDSMFYGSD
jgi:hypothetical protein